MSAKCSLISACGSNPFLAAHAAAYDRYLRYQMIAVVFRGEIAAREHQALLESALVRDRKHAQEIMVSHIRGCVDHSLKEDHSGMFGNPTKPSSANALNPASDTPSNRKSANRPAKSARSTNQRAK